jgi:hypothetical protein
MTTASPPLYPVRVTGRLDQQLSRWLWLVKWLLVLPHVLVLALLWLGFVVLTAAAFVAILVTGRYPRTLFDYNVGVLRWTWRVAYYAYGALGTDEYPPFSLADQPDYPARLEIAYPDHLSRGLALVKWWLLAVPHYLVVGLFLGGGAYAASRDDAAGGFSLVGLLVLFAAVALLVRGSYPRSIFDFVLGMNRWALRVAAYAGLMTDRYPPFRLDLGGTEPSSVAVDAPPPPPAPGVPPSSVMVDAPPPPPAPGPRPAGGWTAGRTTGVVLGSLAMVVGLGLSAGGFGLLLLDGPARGADGYVMTDTERFGTTTAALVEADLDLPVEGPAWFYGPEQLGTLRIDVVPAGDAPVFVGIAARDDAMTFLGSTAYDEVTDLGPQPVYTRAGGEDTSAAVPADAPWWVASAQGAEPLSVTWEAAEGEWAVVVLNADGAPGVAVEARAGATLPHVGAIGTALLGSGLVLLALGVVGVVAAGRAASGGGR